jgi:predicted dinucleotide-binding enzyme
MKIAVLGTGVVGQTLAKGFQSRGHEVMIGSRDAGGDSARKALAAVRGSARAGTFAQAAAFGEVVVLATAWSAAQAALERAGADTLAGKVVADVTNPLAMDASGPRLALGFSTSAGEQVQDLLPRSRVVKAWNTVGASRMVDPPFGAGDKPTMLIAGNDDDAKRTISGLVTAFGWDCIDIGNIEGARLLEPMAMLWITYAKRYGDFTAAFRLAGRK